MLKKGKAISLTGRGGREGCETSRFPHFLESRLTAGVFYASVYQPPGRRLVQGPSINYMGPSSYRKKNLPGRGLQSLRTTVLFHPCRTKGK
jgi:hypothetical protein